jgi:Cu2+-exporting ATPase
LHDTPSLNDDAPMNRQRTAAVTPLHPDPAGACPETVPSCFHCGLPVPAGLDLQVRIDNIERPMCCHGCAAVARAIVDGGLGDFYRFRTAASPTRRDPVPAFLRHARIYDNPEVQSRFVRTQGGDKEASLIIEGITCAACVWLNERYLAALPGVQSVQINYSTHRALIRWDDTKIRLSEILEAVSRTGYLAHPYDPGRRQALIQRERRALLQRVMLAGLLGMQIMTLAVALYAGDWFGIEPAFERFFRWTSLLLCLPVIGYSALPFFTAAWRDLSRRQAGMDVPVALGIALAFTASAWHTIAGVGEVYFDSVAMFTFLLLGARYFELMARGRAGEAAENLLQGVPASASRLNADGSETMVSATELKVGECVRVRPGEAIPIDGRIVAGATDVDESLLTGESRPMSKLLLAEVIGGSINLGHPVDVRVERTGADTVLSTLLRMVERAQADKPAFAQLADRIAARFVVAVLLLAAVVAGYWWLHDSARALPITLSVLVVTCPCALSLATPAALSAATGALTRLGLLVTRGHALETLARATHVVFDKTGTLTVGKPALIDTTVLSNRDARECLSLAAALARQSEHPAARTLATACENPDTASRVESTAGGGLTGRVGDRCVVLGSPAFVFETTGDALSAARMASLSRDGASLVLLADQTGLLAAFRLADAPRPGARALVDSLRRGGYGVSLLSGDHRQAALHIAEQVGIDTVEAGLSPEDKLAKVTAMQAAGAVVAMVGDGVNDAPVLARAQVSVAMGGGTQLAATSADMILLSDNLAHLGMGFTIAKRTFRVIRQNLTWALLYNATALPAAALGLVPPWLAAIGMSASSLLVVANAMRLGKLTTKR